MLRVLKDNKRREKISTCMVELSREAKIEGEVGN